MSQYKGTNTEILKILLKSTFNALELYIIHTLSKSNKAVVLNQNLELCSYTN